MNRLELATQAPNVPDWYREQYKVEYSFEEYLNEHQQVLLNEFKKGLLLCVDYIEIISKGYEINFETEHKIYDLKKQIRMCFNSFYRYDDLFEKFLKLKQGVTVNDFIDYYKSLIKELVDKHYMDYYSYTRELKKKQKLERDLDFDWRFYWADEMIKRNEK